MSDQSTPKDIEYATGATWPVADQASVLREMMKRRNEQREAVARVAVEATATESPDDVEADIKSRSGAMTIAVSGGKGGVGKSNVALNLALALAQLDRQVVLIDANSGHGNADLLCGLNGYWSFEHILTGVRTVEQVLLEGPSGLQILPAADQLCGLGSQQFPPSATEQLRDLELASDVLVIDAGIAANEPIRRMIGSTDCVLLVTSPESTSVADTYATIKHLANTTTDIRIAVNMTRSAEQGQAIFHRIQQTTKSFLDRDISFAGAIPIDRTVVEAVDNRQPFITVAADGAASRCIRQLADDISESVSTIHPDTFFERLTEHLPQRSAA